MARFKDFNSLPIINVAINVIQIHIQKPKGPFSTNHLSSKPKFYSMQLQTSFVDYNKKFKDRVLV
jgi:hypothetical protein